jgi:hypothetical protein
MIVADDLGVLASGHAIEAATNTGYSAPTGPPRRG